MLSSLKIGTLTYPIVEKVDLHSVEDNGVKTSLFGDIRWMAQEIRVSADQSDERKVITVWHEALHGILHNAGQDDQPEAAICALAFGIVELIRDNPELARWTLTDVVTPTVAASE